MIEYIKSTYPQGVPWNPKGVSLAEALKSGAPAPKPAGGAPPPPPPPPPGPPPPPAPPAIPKAAASPAAGGLDAVFNELNKGEAVTKGLRKVNPDQMTHKNPALRREAAVPTRSASQSSVTSDLRAKSPAPSKRPKPESMRTEKKKKPPVKKLDGNKWIIEHYDNEQGIIEVEASISHSILISQCNKSTVVIKGKANAISIDNCKRLNLIIGSLVSSVDVVKASNFALQVDGFLPTILMDQVDGAQVYLTKESMSTEVFTSKCSSVNLNIPSKDEDDDSEELALPEQLRTYIKDGKVVTEIVEHAG
ncbi:putative Adenylyl cyclase-associated protein [Glarea lozoyensis 74030]|nr:putative Adenylyl cyclase-associated protein [Glarea lozoyensis 74030]